MEIYISIDGVIRNLIQKFDYHYVDYYLNSDEIGDKLDVETGEVIDSDDSNFEYGINLPIQNDNILNSYKFIISFPRHPFFAYGKKIYYVTLSFSRS